MNKNTLAVPRYPWLPLATPGYLWLPLAILGYSFFNAEPLVANSRGHRPEQRHRPQPRQLSFWTRSRAPSMQRVPTMDSSTPRPQCTHWARSPIFSRKLLSPVSRATRDRHKPRNSRAPGEVLKAIVTRPVCFAFSMILSTPSELSSQNSFLAAGGLVK